MLRLFVLGGLLAGVLSTGASAYPQSDILAQQCTNQSCRNCVRQCDRALDDRMEDCANQYPRPGEAQELCFYWALSDHNMCLHYECGL